MTPDEADMAACKGMDTEIFFTDAKRREAKATCEECVVRELCLDEALSRGYGDDHGIWGGFSVEERRYLRWLRANPGKQMTGRNLRASKSFRELYGVASRG